ncbi:hypothetical protein BC835DRAFT_1526787 [Cytidiella melzeri]|nr:hypothetical protein BC835DRAFT_1526787 [Cytidiella melzeri]
MSTSSDMPDNLSTLESGLHQPASLPPPPYSQKDLELAHPSHADPTPSMANLQVGARVTHNLHREVEREAGTSNGQAIVRNRQVRTEVYYLPRLPAITTVTCNFMIIVLTLCFAANVGLKIYMAVISDHPGMMPPSRTASRIGVHTQLQ